MAASVKAESAARRAEAARAGLGRLKKLCALTAARSCGGQEPAIEWMFPMRLGLAFHVKMPLPTHIIFAIEVLDRYLAAHWPLWR
jgi:hypothetical protein